MICSHDLKSNTAMQGQQGGYETYPVFSSESGRDPERADANPLV